MDHEKRTPGVHGRALAKGSEFFRIRQDYGWSQLSTSHPFRGRTVPCAPGAHAVLWACNGHLLLLTTHYCGMLTKRKEDKEDKGTA